MTTFPILTRDTVGTDDQREFWDEITQGPRGFYCGGPDTRRLPDLYNAYLHFPEMGRAAFRVADALRTTDRFEGRFRELIVLTTSVMLGARVEYDFHIPFARGEGVSEAVILAIGRGEEPFFDDEGERLVYRANVELLRTATMTEATRQGLVDRIGYDGIMRLIATVVSYVTVAFTTNVARVKLADDFSADPEQMARFFTGKPAA